MSQTEVAALLLVLGGVVALRLNILAVFIVSLGVVVAVVARGIVRDDPLTGVVIQAVISLILFQVSYLFGQMALMLLRRLRASARIGRLPRDDGGPGH